MEQHSSLQEQIDRLRVQMSELRRDHDSLDRKYLILNEQVKPALRVLWGMVGMVLMAVGAALLSLLGLRA